MTRSNAHCHTLWTPPLKGVTYFVDVPFKQGPNINIFSRM